MNKTTLFDVFMIRMSIRFPSFFVLVALAFALVGVRARADETATQYTAEQIAALVQSFYSTTETLKADFDQARYTRLYDRTDRSKGELFILKPGKMRWNYASPNDQVFVANKDRLLIYQPPEKGERNGQLIERMISDDQLPQALSFLMGTGKIDRDFEFRLLPGKKAKPDNVYVLELRPKTRSQQYEQVLFFVQVVKVGSKKAGVIKRVLIVDHSGNRNRFDFHRIRFNEKIPETVFDFTPPKGTVRVKS
ncbi:MAG: outer membrane lipoprotein carrier protein LolA [Polyangiales bacterium]